MVRDMEHLAERLAAQLLSGEPAPSAIAVAEHLLAMQAQDLRGVRLAFRPRTRGLVAHEIDSALTTDRSLVITTLNRGTLHLVTAADYPWLHALTAPTVLTTNATRLRQEGVSPDQAELGVATITRALTREGPLTRQALGERLSAAGVPTKGQALVHVMLLASLRGLTVRGPMVGSEQAHVLVRDWLGRPPKPIDRDVALGELTRRFLRGHGPATVHDLAKWSGLKLGDARLGFDRVSGELAARGDGLYSLRGARTAESMPPPLLLGAFDPVLHGWVSREPILGPKGSAAAGIVTVNGIFRAFALVKGRAAGVWSMPARQVEFEPFGRLASTVKTALAREARDVERFLRE